MYYECYKNCLKQFGAKRLAGLLNAFLVFHTRVRNVSALNRLLPITIPFLLSGCVTMGTFLPGGSQDVAVGPGSSSEILHAAEPSLSARITQQKEIEVIVPVFDPNIPANPNTWEKQDIWPELRRVESINFALQMKKALEDTDQVGAVRVTPDQQVIGDLYVLGKINESNGENVSISIKVVSIGGDSWLNRTYTHRVDEYAITSVRTKDKNPYNPVFERAAADIVKKLRGKKQDYLEELNQLTEVRFGYSMADDSFAQFMKFRGKRVKLIQSPADDDPMLRRIQQYRVEDQLFTDQMQQHYYNFDKKVESSYREWQKAAFSASKAEREARAQAGLKAFAGILAIGLGVAVAANNSDNSSGGNAAAAAGIATGAALLASSAHNYKEAKVHQDTLMELGRSVDVEVAPQVIAFEKKTIELTGNTAAQFNQWRVALRKIYAEERTPGIQL